MHAATWYFVFPMLSRTRLPSGFIEPCLPSPGGHPPSGPGWIHEIKHDGFRLMARRDAVGVRLLTRNGIDWSGRFPLIAEAAGNLKVRSCLIDGEAVACDGNGPAVFERLRRKPSGRHVFLYAFDLLELDGQDLRRSRDVGHCRKKVVGNPGLCFTAEGAWIGSAHTTCY
jgi:ATP-dependent DNA ligase